MIDEKIINYIIRHKEYTTYNVKVQIDNYGIGKIYHGGLLASVLSVDSLMEKRGDTHFIAIPTEIMVYKDYITIDTLGKVKTCSCNCNCNVSITNDLHYPLLSLKEVRTQFEKYHKRHNHPLDTYLDEHGIVCYTVYWIEAQWIGYQRMARDLDILREVE